jgi:hypothetical protein
MYYYAEQLRVSQEIMHIKIVIRITAVRVIDPFKHPFKQVTEKENVAAKRRTALLAQNSKAKNSNIHEPEKST